ncbi:MAG: hypothetical protein WA741_32760 [Candidatus Sulfotelmatobacter sp.]
MTTVMGTMGRVVVSVAAWSVLLIAVSAPSQTSPYERTFPQSRTTIEKALVGLQSSLAGHLPVLDGFAKPGDHPLDRYQRGYYQSTVQISSMPSGGSLVRITTKVTAWYADSVASRSGYQLLASNGRLEADLLDQLAEQLAKSPAENSNRTAAVTAPKSSPEPPTTAEPSISAPAPKFPETDRTFSSSVSQGLAERASAHPADAPNEKSDSALQAEADNLQEILKNTAHPKNLVAVKKSGTPVVSTPSLTAKPQFLASMHDEFEMLDFNTDWVHVRVSGLSRGWIWRNSVEMPDGISDTAAAPTAASLASASDLFHVIREEASTFPGDWEPLKNKNVKIISVQKIDENAKNADARQRLEYAKFLLEKSYKEIALKPQGLAGVVVIFDSADGGMIAATMPTLQQWRAGTLSDSALWHKCFFDPPEMFDSTAPSGGQ